MKRTKRIINTVFIILNILNLAAVFGLMIYSSHMPKPMNWEPPTWLLSAICCVPAFLVINITWLIVWYRKCKNKDWESK